jgi:SRSO17 transposase
MVIAGPETQWQRISAGDGTKGPRLSDWSAIQLPGNSDTQGNRYILARRSIDDTSDLAYYFCYSNKPTNSEELVHVAASRWTVEECFQTAKNEAGLDHYQVRDYTAWYKHMTLSMIALAFLTIIKTAEEKRGSQSERQPHRPHLQRNPATTQSDPLAPDQNRKPRHPLVDLATNQPGPSTLPPAQTRRRQRTAVVVLSLNPWTS